MERTTVELVNEWYERVVRGTTPLGFMNAGYWKGVEDSWEIAQINLIEALVSFFSKRDGSVLDVACGRGASSRFLTKYFDAKNITGINISETQLQVCKMIAPECNFKLMDATKLDFDDSSFDNVLCIEAASHFMTRHIFFEQAYRVLKPGGRLAMQDIVVHDHDRLNIMGPDSPKEIWPKENCLPDLDTYREDLLKVGFPHVRVEDITEFSWAPLMEYFVRKTEMEFDNKQDYKVLEKAMRGLMQSPWVSGYSSWCLAYAIK